MPLFAVCARCGKKKLAFQLNEYKHCAECQEAIDREMLEVEARARQQALEQRAAAWSATLKNIPQPPHDPTPRMPGIIRSETTFMHKEVTPTNLTLNTPLSAVHDFHVVDVETTGLNPKTDEIIQLAAIHFVDFEPVEAFASYAKPTREIPLSARAVNGITDDMLADAPNLGVAVAAFDQFLRDCKTLVGHNLPFDLEFLFWANSWIQAKRNYDTLTLARNNLDYLNPPNYKLDTLCTHILDIARPDAHDALSDCLATGLLFKRICMEKGLSS